MTDRIGIALNNGIVDGNGSNSRVLNQLVPKKAVLGEAGPSLDPSLPSIAEALAVMAGCTLLQSTKDAPFVEFFVRALKPPLSLTKNKTSLTSAELHRTRQHPLTRPIPVLQRLDRSATIRLGRHGEVPARFHRRPLRSFHPEPNGPGLLPDPSRLVRRRQRPEQPLQPSDQQPAEQRARGQLRRRAARRAIPVCVEVAGGWRTCLYGEHGEEGRWGEPGREKEEEVERGVRYYDESC